MIWFNFNFELIFFKILESNKKWWRAVNFSGQVGFVPCTILKKLKLEDVSQDLFIQFPNNLQNTVKMLKLTSPFQTFQICL